MARKIDDAVKLLSGKSKEKAINLYTEALAPTTKATKTRAEKIVPELLERKVVGRLQKIKKKAGKFVTEFGSKIDDAFDALPDELVVKVKPIVGSITDWQQGFMVKGKVINKSAVRLGDELKQVFVQFGDDVDVKSMRKIRQILDEDIARGGGFTADVVTKLDTSVKKAATSNIRGLLAKDFPEIAKLNKTFSFWNNVDDVVGKTLKRTAGQSGKLRTRIGQGVGAAVGTTLGPEGAVAGTFLGGKIVQGLNSAMWKTRSAVWRNRFADALIDGSIDTITLMLKELGVGVVNSTTPEEER